MNANIVKFMDRKGAVKITGALITLIFLFSLTALFVITSAHDPNDTDDKPDPICKPRTIGYWKQPCKGHFQHETQQSMEAHLAVIHNLTDFFDNVNNFSEMCPILNPSHPASMDARARQQIMALWLNVGSGKIFLETQIDLGELSDSDTVEEALEEAESLMDTDDPEKAKDIADKTNNNDGVITQCLPAGKCGNGKIEDKEQCDDGNNESGDGCSAFCALEFCGDKTVNNNGTEQCDDGNNITGDGCNSSCKLEFCGDSILQLGLEEQCDDGNNLNGDGCNFICLLEFCGDSFVNNNNTEQCDDGNNINGDGCNSFCQAEFCGDNILQVNSGEQCDDGNNVTGDGCTPECRIEFCGDDIIQPPEECDDGNNVSEDGCSSICRLEFCGDGVLQAGEECDDGNNVSGDGCNIVCEIEPPGLNKTIGKPREIWDGRDAVFYNISDRCWSNQEGEIECWRVTVLTPITLSCVYPNTTPLENETLCFNIELDGDDVTQNYCNGVNGSFNQTGNSFCCVSRNETPLTIYFGEESEHNLDFYCTDRLGNKTAIDEEKFKVEGTRFDIWLNKKWNLVSVPFILLNSSPEAVFEDIQEDVISVWTYHGKKWFVKTFDGNDLNDNLDSINPGWGYWVLMNDVAVLTIGGSLFSPVVMPPSKDMVNGWNLIGYYGNEDEERNGILTYHGPHLDGNGRKSVCALGSLVDTQTGYPKWSSLVTYWEPDNPSQWKFLDFKNFMNPGAGYWVEVDLDPEEEEPYSPSTVCPSLGRVIGGSGGGNGDVLMENNNNDMNIEV